MSTKNNTPSNKNALQSRIPAIPKSAKTSNGEKKNLNPKMSKLLKEIQAMEELKSQGKCILEIAQKQDLVNLHVEELEDEIKPILKNKNKLTTKQEKELKSLDAKLVDQLSKLTSSKTRLSRLRRFPRSILLRRKKKHRRNSIRWLKNRTRAS